MFAARVWAMAAAVGVAGCTAPVTHTPLPPTESSVRLSALWPADAILLGEQHDAPDHQRIHRDVVTALATQGNLAALVLEMAEQGHSTQALGRQASEDAVRAALQWSSPTWPWHAYGPAVMVAVRAGVPVFGANLSPRQMRDAMGNAALDQRLPGPALQAQQQQIRRGHCDLLPQSQIAPMTRIQIARDVAMAQVVRAAASPGKTVLLLAGSGHVDRSLGVPQHLPPDFKAKTVLLLAGQSPEATENIAKFDQRWSARAAPVVDYCASFAQTRAPAPATPAE